LPQFVGAAYEDMPCATVCRLIHGGISGSILADNDRSNHGRSAISLESLLRENGDDYDDAEETGWRTERPEWWEALVTHPTDTTTREELMELATRNAALAVEAFAITSEFVRVWNSLDWKTQRIVSYAIGHSPEDALGLARLSGELSGGGYTMSRQGIWARLDRACKENPVLEITIRGRHAAWLEVQDDT